MPSDTKLSALYYPHTKAQDPSLLKTALLLWDQLEFIVPYDGFELSEPRPNQPKADDEHVGTAYKLIARPHVPSDDEKRLVHEQVEELLTSPNGAKFCARKDDTLPGNYEIYPQKLLADTWEILKSAGLVNESGTTGSFPGYGQFQDMVTSKKLGLLLMLYLAQACGGDTRRLITDRSGAYNSLNQALATNVAEVKPPRGNDHERIVTRALRVIDPESISLERLVELRTQEVENNDRRLRTLRRKFLGMADQFAVELVAAKQSDISEIERQQDEQMADDLDELKDALKMRASEVLHKKTVWVSMLAAAGAVVAPIAAPAGIFSILELNETRLKYKAARRKAMEDHAMSWLFEASQRGPVALI
jgi:hypothetical protein